MTTVLEPLTAVEALLADQARFDATRPGCPDYCDGTCNSLGHNGTSVIHDGDQVVLPCKAEMVDAPPATVAVRPSRYDQLDDPSEEEVELFIGDSQSHLGDRVPFTAQQAYDLGAALMSAARKLSDELTVLATDVKIGDRLQVSGEWRHVYNVDADEPSFTVQIFTTVDRTCWPELDGDEEPSSFEPTETVRVRRSAGDRGVR